jgi:hypothetical protein
MKSAVDLAKNAIVHLASKVAALEIWTKLDEWFEYLIRLDVPLDPNEPDITLLEDRTYYSANPLYMLVSDGSMESTVADPIDFDIDSIDLSALSLPSTDASETDAEEQSDVIDPTVPLREPLRKASVSEHFRDLWEDDFESPIQAGDPISVLEERLDRIRACIDKALEYHCESMLTNWALPCSGEDVANEHESLQFYLQADIGAANEIEYSFATTASPDPSVASFRIEVDFCIPEGLDNADWLANQQLSLPWEDSNEEQSNAQWSIPHYSSFDSVKMIVRGGEGIAPQGPAWIASISVPESELQAWGIANAEDSMTILSSAQDLSGIGVVQSGGWSCPTAYSL